MVKVHGVELTEEEVKEFREVFSLVDKDGGGSISLSEVMDLLRMLDMKYTEEGVAAMMEEIDTDNNGEVDFDEFLQVMAGSRATSYTRRDLVSAFRMFADKKEPHGLILPQTLEKALATYCPTKVTLEEAMELVGQLKLNAEGKINYVDAINVFLYK